MPSIQRSSALLSRLLPCCEAPIIRRARHRSQPSHCPSSTRFITSTAPRQATEPPLSRATSDLFERLERENRKRAGSATTEGAAYSESGERRTGMGGFPGATLGSGKQSPWAKWDDLSVGGRLARVGRQTGNLTVILFGGGLFCVLTYALTSELFAKNSPTVLLNQAGELIKASDAISPHLLPPYSFTHTRSSIASTSRHSSPIQSQLIRNSATSNEHLILRFWAHGRGINEPSLSWLDYFSSQASALFAWGEGAGRRIVGMATTTSAEREEKAGEAMRRHFEEQRVAELRVRREEEEGASWWGGVFSALRPTARRREGEGRVTMGKKEIPPAGTYTTGEVRADYVKDKDTGNFRLLTLTVDVPSTRASYAQRADIFRADEDEVRREGLLEGAGGTRFGW